MVSIKENLANKANYGQSRSTSSIKYIVVHYTGNDGDTDENNGKYFKNNVVKTSAHYFVDGDSITQAVPDNYVAYHCGATKYKHASCRNSNSLAVELCDDVKNGVVYPSAATIANAVDLVKDLMKKYNVPAANVIRHYDVTGKLCPAYWSGTAAKDKKWKAEFWDKLSATPASKSSAIDPAASFDKAYSKTYTVTASGLNLRAGASTYKPVLRVIPRGEKVTCYGYYTKNGTTVWLYVKDKTGKTGFVSKQYLK